LNNLNAGQKVQLGPYSARILFSEEEIHGRVTAIGASLRQRLGEEKPIFIGLLHGGFVFLADLIRAFGAPHEVDFLQVSRYNARQHDQSEVRVMHDLRSVIHDRQVVVVEGIRARGNKIEYVDRFLRLHRPKNVEYCAMIRPAGANEVVGLSETGFAINQEFVVGYGLDYSEQYRNLAFISALELPPDGGGSTAAEGVA
jgi:hypoxanthine phosphoribosyltransferase